MSERLYVTTDASGVEHTDTGEIAWSLPGEGAAETSAETSAAPGGHLVLRTAASLLEVLDARVFVAETAGTASAGGEVVEASAARLSSETAWDESRAARFALECAEHVLGDGGEVQLPHGATLAEVLADARAAVEGSSTEAEERLGLVAAMRAAHRLRREGASVEDVALALLVDDDALASGALDDPAWATAAAVVEAVSAAVEAIRAFALPRYTRAREALASEPASDAPVTTPAVVATPWGPVALGTQPRSGYAPSWVCARDAAERARDAARERAGAIGARDELAFQVALLESLLGGAPD